MHSTRRPRCRPDSTTSTTKKRKGEGSLMAGTASIRKRQRSKGTVYEARWRFRDPATGDVSQHGKTFRTEAEAKAFLVDVRHQLKRGTAVRPSDGRTAFS